MLKRLLSAILMPAAMILLSCSVPETDVVTEVVTVTVVETVVETVEVKKASPYAYELLREMAESDNYIGDPAAGHSMAFANLSGKLPYARLVREGIMSEWVKAGGREEDLLVMDNMADRETALENAETAFGRGVEVFLQFFGDGVVNAHIGMQASQEGIYMIGVEVPVPGFPLMGIDNYEAGQLAGDWAADMVDKVYGGWEDVDRVVYLDAGDSDSKTSLRIFGAMTAMEDKFGPSAGGEALGSKAVTANGILMPGDGGRAINNMLQDHPDDNNIIVFCLNDGVADGMYQAALDVERWDPNNWLIISFGYDDRGRQLLVEGIIDADIVFFPERYGDYLIPAALAHIYGNPVPPYIYMDIMAITRDDLE